MRFPVTYLRNTERTLGFYIEQKFGEERNAVETLPCVISILLQVFKFSQTFTNAFKPQKNHGENVSYFFQETLRQKEIKNCTFISTVRIILIQLQTLLTGSLCQRLTVLVSFRGVGEALNTAEDLPLIAESPVF